MSGIHVTGATSKLPGILPFIGRNRKFVDFGLRLWKTLIAMIPPCAYNATKFIFPQFFLALLFGLWVVCLGVRAQ